SHIRLQSISDSPLRNTNRNLDASSRIAYLPEPYSTTTTFDGDRILSKPSPALNSKLLPQGSSGLISGKNSALVHGGRPTSFASALEPVSQIPSTVKSVSIVSPEKPQAPAAKLNIDDVHRKTVSLLQEYFNVRLLDEALHRNAYLPELYPTTTTFDSDRILSKPSPALNSKLLPQGSSGLISGKNSALVHGGRPTSFASALDHVSQIPSTVKSVSAVSPEKPQAPTGKLNIDDVHCKTVSLLQEYFNVRLLDEAL
ncbi:hypothetical protein RYX36_031409, partial [Vicia faba]